MTVTLDYALIGLIVQQLKARGSWCGETHIQKTAYAAKEVLKVPLSTSFVLYKHGPYSFDLNGILTSMRADRLLSLVPKGQYGPSFSIEPAMSDVFRRFDAQIGPLKSKIQHVATAFAAKNVSDLEEIATAIYITKKMPQASAEVRASELNRVKPHINVQSALTAVAEADRFLGASIQNEAAA